jgi:hypothetical protein
VLLGQNSTFRKKKPVEAGGKLSPAWRLLLLVSCFTHYSFLKIEAMCPSETSGSELHGVTTRKTFLLIETINNAKFPSTMTETVTGIVTLETVLFALLHNVFT